MTDQARRTAISRRHLIRTGAAAALFGASSVVLRAEPKPSGILRLAAPGGAGGTLERLVAPGSVFDCLTEVGADGQLRGELAEAWEPSRGGAVWAVTLRGDARFHDGRNFGAEDVVASLRHHMTTVPDLGLSSVRKTGKQQVLVTLNSPDPGFPFLLSDPNLVILPADDPEKALRDGIGTGLYRIDRTREGLRLERVVEHYKDGRAGWFEALELLGIDDPAERTRAFLAGRVDAVAAPDPAVLRHVSGTARPVRVAAPGGRHLQVRARGTHAAALAAAVKTGLDRDALLDGFLAGQGRIAGDAPIDAPGPAYDPERARHGLAQAGIDRATLGFGSGLQGLPGLDGFTRVVRHFAHDVGLELAAATDPDLEISLSPAQPTDDLALRRFPTAGLSDPDCFHGRLAEARTASDSGVRREIHAEVAQILADQAHTAVPVFADATFLHSARLTHLGHIGALEMFDSARIAERWSYASPA